ncbi:cation-translocating P-type ATPase [uncultured Piscinibacter sp.]|uniref:heavy metal translocating P-type ATPase n=1 Tax=uncultured Piscinibacter sp. TaxID=1131835 RepID=UPI0026327331|nr:cation-translocating P-type ATPase [uncultured Piscinibacter sp.]
MTERAVAGAADPDLRALDDPLNQASFTTWALGQGGEREATSQFRLSGMYCAACAGVIEDALLDVEGVREARVHAATSLALVRWDPQRTRASALVEAVRRAGYGAVPDAAASARAQREAEQRKALWRLFVAGFCMMQVMMYATPAYVSEPGDITPDMLRLLQWASWVLSLPVMLFSAGPFFAGAWNSVKQRRMGMDVPVSLGIAVTFVASSGATFDPGGLFGHEVYFDSLTMFVFFLLGGRWLELRARHRVALSLEAGTARLPDSVERLREDGLVEAVAVARLVAGDRVRVPAGQAFPADGVLLEGRSLADEALLTGESAPVPKQAGDEVVAGSINLRAPVLMQVLRLGEDTRQAGIVALMRSALTQRPRLVLHAERIAGPFLWAVLALAAGAAAVWSVLEPSRAIWVAVSVLIVTCPCALSLAAPSALLAATGGLARRGVLLQRIEALEALADIDTVAFDKTGTLTRDQLELGDIRVPHAGDDASALLARAASLAALSAHPASRALAQAADPVHGDVAWGDVQEVPGQGLEAHAEDGVTWRLGRREWVGAAPADTPDGALCFGPVGEVRAEFLLREQVRDDAAATLARLQADGVRVALLSGDAPDRATELARRLGIADVRGAATPADKLDAVAAWQAEGRRVAMVGDGLNDAPVLARADVSFAFAHGSAVARSGADVVLLGERLGDVVLARRQARRTLRVIRQNLGWAALYNTACVPLALVGWLPPWAAGIGMASSSLLVVLNALRLARIDPDSAAGD